MMLLNLNVSCVEAGKSTIAVVVDDRLYEVQGWSSTQEFSPFFMMKKITFYEQVQSMILPVLVSVVSGIGSGARWYRTLFLEEAGQDYVRTARAKGMSESVVVMRHVLRNSMIPVVTVIALGIPSIFGGAIITEQVFKVNGLGQLLIIALQGSDIPMVMTITFLLAVLIVLMNLIADILYGVLDPRIRYD